MRRLIRKAEKKLKGHDERLAAVRARPGYSVGAYGSTLGLIATTPCAEIEDRTLRRIAFEAVVRDMLPPLPAPGAVVCHRCDNRKCVKAEHLFWGTVSDNIKDCALKGRRRKWVTQLRKELLLWRIELAVLLMDDSELSLLRSALRKSENCTH